MAPIAVVRSCFSTRNGTPRQPLLVPLAKASLIFDSARVRVPRLKGERIGVFATRSPHRLCPIGLTVAKVEAVHGHTVLLSGVDLVDGTPVLDIKPYLPYCDNIQGAMVPDWVKVDNVLAVASVDFSESFFSSLVDCWSLLDKKSLYASPDEFQCLIRQVLSWDIRSVSQRTRPHQPKAKVEAETMSYDDDDDIEMIVNRLDNNSQEDEASENGVGELVFSPTSDDVVYHLILEGLNVSYRIDSTSNVLVEKVSIA
ncbi:Nef-associated protein [Striga asiatica]|uniref:Nef-associated protein n=1 Tax=Striga asiatica TaxID=4170 RepID=A0A5A7PYS3_STRAF|nr:Nef-associated protein [Striga asiatica]